MWYRYTDGLRAAIFRADAIRQSEGFSWLSTRHLLQGIAGFGAAADILPKLTSVEALLQTAPTIVEGGHTPRTGHILTDSARDAVDNAYRLAAKLGDDHIGTEHLLLAFLTLPDTEAGAILAGHRIGLQVVSEELMRLQTGRTILPEGSAATPEMHLAGRRLRKTIQDRWHFLVRIALALTQLADDPIVFSFLFTRQRLEKPYLFFRRLRRRGFYRSRAAGGWVVSSYEDVQAALREPALSARRFDLAFPRKEPTLPPHLEMSFNQIFGGLNRQMLFLDAPEQTRLRSLVSRQFTPRVLAAIRTEIQQVADQLLDAVEGRNEIDVIADYSFPLPATVIARLLGVDDRPLEQFKSWSDAFVRLIGSYTHLKEDLCAYESLETLTHYFRGQVNAVRARPPDTTLLSLLANAVDEDGSRLTDDEVIMNALLLLAAGHETTTHLIGNGLSLLLQHPEELARLRADPARMPGAVEEMLRQEGPVQWTSRIARQSFLFKGQEIPTGMSVNIALAAANRDPARFPEPDRFDSERTDNRHVAFGYGAHFCLGAALARMETEIALNTLLRRFPAIRLAKKRMDWRHDFTFRAQRRLPVLLR